MHESRKSGSDAGNIEEGSEQYLVCDVRTKLGELNEKLTHSPAIADVDWLRRVSRCGLCSSTLFVGLIISAPVK